MEISIKSNFALNEPNTDSCTYLAINSLNTGLTSRHLPVTVYDVDYADQVSTTALYVSHIAIINVAISVKLDVPEWTKILVSKINAGNFEPSWAIAAIPSDSASTFMTNVDANGTIYFNSHNSVIKKGWYYTSIITVCNGI